MGQRRSTPPRQRKGQKRGSIAPQITPSVGPPSVAPAALESSPPPQTTSELDQIDAGWD
jgi:hypothetical protein